MKFKKYLNESTHSERYNKYFKSGEFTDLYIKKVAKKGIFFKKTPDGLDLIKDMDVSVGDKVKLITGVDPVIVPGRRNNYFVAVQYKHDVVYVNVNNLDTPTALSRGESLNIQATNLIQSGNNARETIVLWGKEYPGSDFKEFTSSKELATSIQNGFHSNKKVPKEVAESMDAILTSNKFSTFDWGKITKQTDKNQIGKYYGELLVGLCLLNNELSAFHGNIKGMLGNAKIESFLMPISPSFPAADSLIKTNLGIIPISNKKGGGTGASFYTNLVPLLVDIPDSQLKTKSKILLQMKHVYQKINNKRQVLQQIYEWGFTYLLDYVKPSYSLTKLYNTILKFKGKDQDHYDEDLTKIIKYVKINTFSDISKRYEKAVQDNMPHSLTHLFLYHLSEILSKDKEAKNIILTLLGAKNYWQADLQNKEWNLGKAVFKLKQSNQTELTFSPTRGGIRQVSSPHAKLNYILK